MTDNESLLNTKGTDFKFMTEDFSFFKDLFGDLRFEYLEI